MTVKTKAGITLVQKNGLNFMVEDGHRPRRFRPWPGDSFSFLYDRIMKDSVFPRKFGGDTGWHYPFTIYNTLSQRVDVPPAGAAITVVMALAGQTISLVGMTYLYAWLYNNTGSVFLAILFHGLSNFPPAVLLTAAAPSLTVITAVMPWLVVFVLEKIHGKERFPGSGTIL